MSRFAYTYEDPEYEISEEMLDEPTEQEVEDEEVYSPYNS